MAFATTRLRPLVRSVRASGIATTRSVTTQPALGHLTNALGVTREAVGADDGTRTRDPHLGKVMLYQLSHVREESQGTKATPSRPR
jgi:hypothetical protein